MGSDESRGRMSADRGLEPVAQVRLGAAEAENARLHIVGLGQMPMLAIVGGSDSIIPANRSRALFDAWTGPKTWHVVPDAGHNDLGRDDAFWQVVAGFLAER